MVNMMQTMQPVTVGNSYSTPTDGFLLGWGTGPSTAGSPCAAFIYAVCSNGTEAWAAVGNTVIWRDSFNATMWNNNNSLMLPVPANSTFYTQWVFQPSPPSGFVLPNLVVAFIPLGSSARIQQTTAEPAFHKPPIPDIVLVRTPHSRLLETIGEILLEGETPDRKQRLAEVLGEAFPR